MNTNIFFLNREGGGLELHGKYFKDLLELRPKIPERSRDLPPQNDPVFVIVNVCMCESLFVVLLPLQTIDFELRKLDAQQATEHINLLKSFMPNTFLISGGT